MRKSQRIGFIPIKIEMPGISGDHFKIGVLIRILEAQFKAESVGQRKTIIDAVAWIYYVILFAHLPLDNVATV